MSDGRQPRDLSEQFRQIKSRRAALHELDRLASNVDLAEEGKLFWKKKAQELDLLLRGRTVVLAGLVHQVGGEVCLTEETLRLMDSGEYTLSQHSNKSDETPQVRLVVKHQPKDHANTEENEGKPGGAGDRSDHQPPRPADPQ